MGGRREAVPTYGPPGVKNIVEGFGQAYAMDQTYRTAHHEEENMPHAGSRATAVEFPLPPPGGAEVLTTSRGIKVTAFEMDHYPVHPAVGYRFEFHSGPLEAMADAAKYQTKLLVICHFAPPMVNLIQRLLAKAVYRKTPAGWSGGIAWGQDGDH